jgi:hypothetical protein
MTDTKAFDNTTLETFQVPAPSAADVFFLQALPSLAAREHSAQRGQNPKELSEHRLLDLVNLIMAPRGDTVKQQIVKASIHQDLNSHQSQRQIMIHE